MYSFQSQFLAQEQNYMNGLKASAQILFVWTHLI